MPTTVSAAFDAFYNTINLGGDHRSTANSRRESIVSLLQSKLTVIDSFPSGSIPKYTALHGHADLDVIVQLHYGKHIEGKSCTQVLQSVRDALAGKTNSVRRNGQAVTLKYTTWPNVDIVPVARINDSLGNFDHYLVPNTNDNVWIKSRPKQHADAIEKRSGDCGPNFRKIIKMVKEWNRTHSKYLQSYHIEVLALQIFTSDLSDLPLNTYIFFRDAYEKSASKIWYDTGYADEYLGYVDRTQARQRLATARDVSLSAWHAVYQDKDHKKAITLWKQLFGDQFPAYG